MAYYNYYFIVILKIITKIYLQMLLKKIPLGTIYATSVEIYCSIFLAAKCCYSMKESGEFISFQFLKSL